MTWEQIFILIWIVVGLFMAVHRTVRLRGFEPHVIALCVVLDIALKAAVVLVLHAGGFW